MVTIVADREGDIYEEWALRKDARTHLLARAALQRIFAETWSKKLVNASRNWKRMI